MARQYRSVYVPAKVGQRLKYSYLRRVKGRKRRKRIYVYETVTIRKSYTRRVPIKGKPKPKPKPKKVPKLTVDATGWMHLPEYIEQLYDQAADIDALMEFDERIYHNDEQTDYIDAGYQFVYPRPVNLQSYLDDRKIVLVRAWFLVWLHKEKQANKYIVWSMARSLGMRKHAAVTTLNMAYRHIKEMEKIIEKSAGKFSYMTYKNIVAWTAWDIPFTAAIPKRLQKYRSVGRSKKRRKRKS